MNWEKGFDKFETSNQLTSAGQQIEMAYQNVKRTLKKRIKNEVWLSNYKYTNMGKLLLKTQCSFTPSRLFSTIEYTRYEALYESKHLDVLMLVLKMNYVFQKPGGVQKRYCEKFVKLQAAALLSKGFDTGIFLWIFQNFSKRLQFRNYGKRFFIFLEAVTRRCSVK